MSAVRAPASQVLEAMAQDVSQASPAESTPKKVGWPRYCETELDEEILAEWRRDDAELNDEQEDDE